MNLQGGVAVVADAKLRHPADFDCPTINVSNTAVGNGLRSLQAGQRFPASWVNLASATTCRHFHSGSLGPSPAVCGSCPPACLRRSCACSRWVRYASLWQCLHAYTPPLAVTLSRRGVSGFRLGQSFVFRLRHQFRSLHSKRLRQLENGRHRRLVLPGLDQGNEVSLDPRLQTKLLLRNPSGKPEPAQSPPKRDVRFDRKVSQHMVKLSDFP